MLKMRLINPRYYLLCRAPGSLSLLIAFTLLVAFTTSAKERLHRILDHNSGLPMASLSG